MTAALKDIFELDERIAVPMGSIRNLIEQAAAYSGAAELVSGRIAEQEVEL
jgi:hypothetical protein